MGRWLGLALFAVVAPAAADRVRIGSEVLRSSGWSDLIGHRTAVLSHPAGVFPDDLQHIVDILNGAEPRAAGVDVVAALAPEHGFRGDHQAEAGDPDRYIDVDTGLPVLSVYRKNADEICYAIRSVNATTVLVDIQDVGTRLYTFVWTLFDVMAAVAADDKSCGVQRFVVLDRPNPLGGRVVEGPLLNTSCCGSRYGRAAVPHRHGMTVGELASLFAQRELRSFGAALRVVKMEGWRRDMSWDETGLPWVPPSPNLPTARSTLAYSATVFIEATTVTEGRGTTTPFELFGAPFYRAPSLAAKLNKALDCGDVACFRAAFFTPTFFKYNGSVVPAVQWVRLPTSGETFPAAVRILLALRELAHEGDFRWDGSWFGTAGSRLLDLYAGTPELRVLIDENATAESITARFGKDSALFVKERTPYLRYADDALIL